jgi:hypothetical protein
MTEGFIVDQGYGVAHASTYQTGEPRKSIWTGIKQNKKDQFPITSLRCNRCGYLENYAKG